MNKNINKKSCYNLQQIKIIFLMLIYYLLTITKRVLPQLTVQGLKKGKETVKMKRQGCRKNRRRNGQRDG